LARNIISHESRRNTEERRSFPVKRRYEKLPIAANLATRE
jgi:hypothetical protein